MRVCEHLRITPLTGKISKTQGRQSAISDHILLTGHQGSFDNFAIIGVERSRNDFLLRLKESLLIKRDIPTLNEAIQSTPLELFK